RRYTAILCCDLAALSPAVAARLYISSVLPLNSVTGVARAKPISGRPNGWRRVRMTWRTSSHSHSPAVSFSPCGAGRSRLDAPDHDAAFLLAPGAGASPP